MVSLLEMSEKLGRLNKSLGDYLPEGRRSIEELTIPEIDDLLAKHINPEKSLYHCFGNGAKVAATLRARRQQLFEAGSHATRLTRSLPPKDR